MKIFKLWLEYGQYSWDEARAMIVIAKDELKAKELAQAWIIKEQYADDLKVWETANVLLLGTTRLKEQILLVDGRDNAI